MAMRTKFGLTVDAKQFNSIISVTMSKVQTGSKKATRAACETIKEWTLEEVPRETNTLADSFGYEIVGSIRNFSAVIGYGILKNPINPKRGEKASSYMIAVHEDLSAKHLHGKAKFFEDPLNRYAQRFDSDAVDILRKELGM